MKSRFVLKVLVFSLAVTLTGASACKSDDAAEPAGESAAEQTAEATDRATEGEEAAEDEGEQQAEPEAKEAAELPDDLPAGETGKYGGEFTIEDDPVTLAAALDQAESGGTYKVSANVEKVCKKKGCWFTLTDEGVDEPVRVKMKDYGFFVPRNSDGARATVEGELVQRTIPQDEAQHYADDEVAGTDKEPRKVEGDQTKWEMMITAAQVEMPAKEDSAAN
ncbi:MAG: DUF4920 domain-containing protein [Myxococcota bacterium]